MTLKICNLLLAGFASFVLAACGDSSPFHDWGHNHSHDGNGGTPADNPGAVCQGEKCVDLGTAGKFVILAKAGIATVPNSVITGSLGVSPIDQTAITGFALVADATNEFSTSAQVTGKVYAADFAPPTPSNLTTAVSDMETAYTTAAGLAADVTELGAGDISGKTLKAKVYKWGTGVVINADVTLEGGPDDVWVFQVAQDVTQAAATKIILAGGAQSKNVFWQIFGILNVGTTAHFVGVALVQTAVSVNTGATVDGRLLAQTAVTLNQNTVTQPE